MQNWENIQPNANYDQHNAWYNSMFAATIKQEPGTSSSCESSIAGSASNSGTTQLEQYLKQHQHQQQQQQQQGHPQQPMDTMSLTMTPSPSNNDSNLPHFFDANAMQQQFLQQQHYQQQFQHAQQAAAQNHHHLPLGFNPLTPPGLPNAVLPPPPGGNNGMQHFYGNLRSGQQHQPQTSSPQPAMTPANLAEQVEKLQAALTPRNTPPMDVTPPKSPKSAKNINQSNEAAEAATSKTGGGGGDKDQDLISNSSEDMKYLAEPEEEDDETIRMPIYNSHGKMKNYKCKTCGMVSITKVAFWDHTRTHMKPDKILQCPKCPFVTEFKHHLEYHIRKHKNQKPFQCDKCSYTCVNKSMLNSHRKSHSSVYQYRCADCDYATKYCHSFKLHLRKYDHKPGMVLDEEGNPNPSLVIDVYGTRRGPKNKSSNTNGGSTTNNGTSGSASSSGGGGGGSTKRGNGAPAASAVSANDLKVLSSQLTAALQGFAVPSQQQQRQASPQPMCISPAKNSNSPELPALSVNMALQQQVQQQQQQQQQQQNLPANAAAAAAAASLLPPLATMLQQNPNMAFFPYWNLNLQMLAAQQQAVLAQLSPTMRETALQQIKQHQQQLEMQNAEDAAAYDDDDDAADQDANEHAVDDEDTDDEEDIEEEDNNDNTNDHEPRSVDSAMDLSQGTPLKEEEQHQQQQQKQQQKQTPAADANVAINLKLQDDHETPLLTSNSRRKGRVLKLDTSVQPKSASTSPEPETSSSDESQEHNAKVAKTVHNDSVPSSSGNSSNSSNSPSSSPSTLSTSSPSPNVPATVPITPANTTVSPFSNYFECKYCEIFFKDAVLYTIHMGYHSCDDVFKCNMCGEKCDGPVGLFVHVTRKSHD